MSTLLPLFPLRLVAFPGNAIPLHIFEDRYKEMVGEAETAGVVLNVVPRDGGNTFSGMFAVNGASGGMQASNYTQALQDAGLRSPAKLLKV